jgi:TolB-like protein/DNA-binding winged helix-turn-helix (wHTH) protein/Tfp pilus assembly protein PilF
MDVPLSNVQGQSAGAPLRAKFESEGKFLIPERIGTHLRRSEPCDMLALPMPDATQSPAVRRFGAFEINTQSGELRKNGMRLRLSGQPFQVLAVLVERAGEVVTREELHSTLWPADTFVDFDHGLNNAVARIREILDDSSEAPRYVETIPRRGYRFIAPLSDLAITKSSSIPELTLPAEVAPAPPSDVPVTSKVVSTRLWLVLGGVAALAVLAAGMVLYQERRASSAPQQPVKSLAVLPLKNLSGDPSQEYLADGMTEELIGRLSMIRGLRVISRTSVMAFKDPRMSMPQIARALGVDALVEGSVIRDGSRVRVHAQLIRGATDEHFWSETYDRELRDALSLESEVAESIAQKVKITVTGEERSRLGNARQVAPEVYESYLKGRSVKGNDREKIEERIAYFEEAIRQDPTFAPAYVGLAGAHSTLSTIFVGGPAQQERQQVGNAAKKALELDSDLAEAHVLLANIRREQWQWAQAEAEYKRALNLKPNDAGAHIGLAEWLMCQGQVDEALNWARRGRELDPLGASGVSIAWILFQARRYDEAIRELHTELEIHPDDVWAQSTLGFALMANGQPEEAITILKQTMLLMKSSPGSLELLATAYAKAGRRSEALRLINELKKRRQRTYIPAGALINPHLALGDYDEAFVWFERAYQEKSNILQFLKVHPFFDPVRDDPRFKDLVHRVGLD